MSTADPLPAGNCPRQPAPGLWITGQRTSNSVTLRVGGEIDLDTAPVLEAEIYAWLRCPPVAVTVDLSSVTFIDCSGLNSLLRSHARAAREHTTVRIGPVSATMDRFLTLVCAMHPLPDDLFQNHGQPVPATAPALLALSIT